MLTTVNVSEAKMHLSRLLDRTSQGEEIIIAKAGKPVARLVSLKKRPLRHVPGSSPERIVVGRDFDAPLPEEVLEIFER